MPAGAKRWLVEPLIPEGGVCFIFGKYSTYKTPISLSLARAIARGEDLWDLEVPAARRVLYIEVDMPDTLAAERMQGIPVGNAPNLDILLGYPGFDCLRLTPEDLKIIGALRAEHAKHPYGAVFVDALQGVVGGDVREAMTVKSTYKFFSDLFPSAALVYLHHSKKSIKDEVDEDETFSGSQAWVNHAATALHVKRPDKRKPWVELRQTKNQLGEAASDLFLEIEDGARVKLRYAQVSEKDIQEFISNLDQTLTSKEKDRAIAEHFGWSTRTAQRRRLELK